MRIVTFGDSVTEGCFDIIRIRGELEILRDPGNAYGAKLIKRLQKAYPDKTFELVNTGISGNDTHQALERFDADVLQRDPDLVITCFGLNDAGQNDVTGYADRMERMFAALEERGIPTVFMTPNMMNKYVTLDTDDVLLETARSCAHMQDEGRLDVYLDEAKVRAAKHGVIVVDAYAEWKRLESYGVDTTALLCNHINHPSRKMHNLFADMLFAALQANNLIK